MSELYFINKHLSRLPLKLNLCLFLGLILFSYNISAQTEQTFYFNENWEPVESMNNAFYYRKVTFNADGKPDGIAKTYYITGELQFEGKLISVDPEVADGLCIWYDKQGNIINTDFYKDGESNNDHVEEYFKQGTSLAGNENFREAASIFLKAYETEMQNPEYREPAVAGITDWIAYCSYHSGDYLSTIKYYDIALPLYEKLGMTDNIYASYMNAAYSARYTGNFQKQIQYSLKAVGIAITNENEESLPETYTQIAIGYEKLGEYDMAIEYINKAISVNKKLNNKSGVAVGYSNIGFIFYAQGKTEEALKFFEKAKDICLDLDDKFSLSTIYSNLGELYMAIGYFDRAEENIQKAIDIEQEQNQETEAAKDFRKLGLLYCSWGNTTKGEKYLEKAINVLKDTDLGEEEDLLYSDKGMIAYIDNNNKLALDNYLKAYDLSEKSGNYRNAIIYCNSIAKIWIDEGDLQKAASYYEKGLQFAKTANSSIGQAKILKSIGNLNRQMGKYEDAISRYNKCIEIFSGSNMSAEVADALFGIGVAYYEMQNFRKAIEYYQKAIDLIEKLRIEASGEIRRDYLSNLILYYQTMVSACLHGNEIGKAFYIAELSSGKYLTDQLAENQFTKDMIHPVDIDEFIKGMSKNSAIIRFINIDMTIPSVRLLAMQEKNVGTEILDHILIDEATPICTARIKKDPSKKALSLNDKVNLNVESGSQKISVKDIINVYREMLSDNKSGNLDNPEFVSLSKSLYNFLFNDMEKDLEGKDELVIIPDGILAFLPFETLIMPDGRYLCEKFNIRYSLSVTSEKLIADRKYSKDRHPMLSLGGAVYAISSYSKTMETSRGNVDFCMKTAAEAIGNKENMRGYYANLGRLKWQNLPGTLNEVKQIKEIIPESKMLTGDDASESSIKALSLSGDLEKYTILHFASHGITFPEYPEMSSLVLSLSDSIEDGYLMVNEIRNLKIKADFINLSACQTGLGKVYSGEGVVGLSQAFLVAGAKGISVSLWSVNDNSTMEFMTDLYKEISANGMNYYQAMNHVRKKFIHGDFGEHYKAPVYWAPFVYYGAN